MITYFSCFLQSYQTLRGSVVNGAGTLTAPTTRPPGRICSDSIDIPPRVPPRRESISPRPISQNRPAVRVSTTLPAQRPAAVQQIPRELATTSKRREKSMKGKRAHKRAHSAGQASALRGFCWLLNLLERSKIITLSL